eukprot:7167243-Lingulodinium_polyedra.AAC.1
MPPPVGAAGGGMAAGATTPGGQRRRSRQQRDQLRPRGRRRQCWRQPGRGAAAESSANSPTDAR